MIAINSEKKDDDKRFTSIKMFVINVIYHNASDRCKVELLVYGFGQFYGIMNY